MYIYVWFIMPSSAHRLIYVYLCLVNLPSSYHRLIYVYLCLVNLTSSYHRQIEHDKSTHISLLNSSLSSIVFSTKVCKQTSFKNEAKNGFLDLTCVKISYFSSSLIVII
jgi:hypothetical protein